MRKVLQSARCAKQSTAAVLVASIRPHFRDVRLHLGHRAPNVIPCDAPFRKGEETGWYQHGSTVTVFVPDGFELCQNLRKRSVIRVG